MSSVLNKSSISNISMNDMSVNDKNVDNKTTIADTTIAETTIAEKSASLLVETAPKSVPVIVDKPLHVVLVTETWYPDVNGVSMSLAQLMTELKHLGHNISLIRPEPKKIEAGTQQQALLTTSQNANKIITQDIQVKGVPIPRYSDMQFGLPQYRFIKRQLKNMQTKGMPVDIVHIATEGPLGLASLMAAKRLKLPVTTGYHTQFHDFSKHFGMGMIAKPLISYFKWFHNWSDATCVPSKKTQDDLSELGFERITQVGRGVDKQRFNPARRSDELRASWGANAQHTVLVMVSRLSPEKGVDVVIEAFRALQTTQMQRATKLVIVGSGPDLERLEALAMPCEDDVIFTGAKMGTDLATHYASGDAFIFASQVETFGNVVTEAMASGLPVFAFDDAAAGMLVTEETGALAPIGQKQAFIDMVAQLPKMKRLQQQGRSAVQAVEQFSWSRPAKQMLIMFNQAVDEHKDTQKSHPNKSNRANKLKSKLWFFKPIPQAT